MISCSIFDQSYKWALCDLGSSINIMLKVIFEQLQYPALSQTRMFVQLADSVGVYCQACLGIPLAVGFVGKDRRLWNSMVQGTQRYRQVWAASFIIPYFLCGCLYCLRC